MVRWGYKIAGHYWGNRWVYYFDCGDGFRLCTNAKTYQTMYVFNTCSLLYVNYTSINCYQTKNVCLPACINGQSLGDTLCRGKSIGHDD